MSDECNQCEQGFTTGVPFPPSIDTPHIDGGLKISTVCDSLKISDAHVEPIVDAIDVCNSTPNSKSAMFKVPNWMLGAICATKIRLSGIDEQGFSATMSGSGLLTMKDGLVSVEDNPSFTADCLHHTSVNGNVGEPLASEHIAITDGDGKVKSQKPKAGQMGFLLADGITMQWRQVDIEELKTLLGIV